MFCDASERAYGAVAYLTVQAGDTTHISFVMARSRVAPKRQQSIPRLELCAALAGAQAAKLIETEMTLPLRRTVLQGADSTTVLEWRYIDSPNNPACDITRGKALLDLAEPGHRSQGPSYLKQSEECWPKKPEQTTTAGSSELKSITFCGFTAVEPNNSIPDASQYSSWEELVEATHCTHGAATDPEHDQPLSRTDVEALRLRVCQVYSFSEEVAALKAQKPVPNHSHLLNLAPEWDDGTCLIRVGGRLRRLQNPSIGEIRPIVLDPKHPAVKLLIKDMDERLLHPGTERVYPELRRQYWILRGRQAIRHHQLSFSTCQRWRAQPKVPQMADLPPQRL